MLHRWREIMSLKVYGESDDLLEVRGDAAKSYMAASSGGVYHL
jgi:hypothetical protein